MDLMDRAVAALPRCCGGKDGRPVPTLMLYGEQDLVVPARMTRAAVASVPAETGLRMGVYEGGYHLLLSGGNREEVVRDVLTFLNDPHAPLPSDAEARAPAWLAR